MLKWLKRIGVTLGLIHVLTYVFLSDMMLERRVCDKYLEFTERRFANPYNKNVSESIFVSSCGDEFFRDISNLENVALASNPDFPAIAINNWDNYQEPEFTQFVKYQAYPHDDVLGTINANTDTLETGNCILFEICSIRSIPCFLKQVEYVYFYSSQPTDFHIMMYTDRGLRSASNYVWALFTWVDFNGEIVNAFE
jgi:hypothetical protein